MSAVVAEGVTKCFGSLVALADVHVRMQPGEIVGLLGRNGAGKTTLIGVLAGLLRPDAGTVTVPPRQERDGPVPVGLAGQEIALYPPLTVAENLVYFAQAYGVRGRAGAGRRIDTLAGALDFGHLLDRRVHTLSGGERRRVHVAAALVHSPALVLLDEPTAGADMLSRQAIISLVSSMARDDDTAVLYSTHYLEEVTSLRARVVLLERGRVVTDAPAAGITANLGASVVRFRSSHPLRAVSGLHLHDASGGWTEIVHPDPVWVVTRVLRAADAADVAIVDLRVEQPNLETMLLFQEATDERPGHAAHGGATCHG